MKLIVKSRKIGLKSGRLSRLESLMFARMLLFSRTMLLLVVLVRCRRWSRRVRVLFLARGRIVSSVLRSGARRVLSRLIISRRSSRVVLRLRVRWYRRSRIFVSRMRHVIWRMSSPRMSRRSGRWRVLRLLISSLSRRIRVPVRRSFLLLMRVVRSRRLWVLRFVVLLVRLSRV